MTIKKLSCCPQQWDLKNKSALSPTIKITIIFLIQQDSKFNEFQLFEVVSSSFV